MNRWAEESQGWGQGRPAAAFKRVSGTLMETLNRHGGDI